MRKRLLSSWIVLLLLLHSTTELSSSVVWSVVDIVYPQVKWSPINLDFEVSTSAHYKTNIFSVVSGYIEKIHLGQGERVQRGDLLFSISNGDYIREVNSAQQALRRSKGAREAIYNEYNNVLRKYKRNRGRKRELMQLTEQLASAGAELNNAKYLLLTAKEKLDNTKIYAPFTGLVEDYRVQAGDYIDGDQQQVHLATIHSIDSIHTWIPLTVNQYLRYMIRDRSRRRLFNDSSLFSSIKLKQSDGDYHPSLGRYRTTRRVLRSGVSYVEIGVAFANPEHTLKPMENTTLSAKLPFGREIMIIPRSAVREQLDRSIVLVIGGDGRVHSKEVELGNRYALEVEVIEGLVRSDRVLLYADSGLVAGQRVELR